MFTDLNAHLANLGLQRVDVSIRLVPATSQVEDTNFVVTDCEGWKTLLQFFLSQYLEFCAHPLLHFSFALGFEEFRFVVDEQTAGLMK